MPPTTDTDLKEFKDLVIGLREEMRVGFAQVDTKFAQMEAKMDTKFAQVDTKLAQLEGKADTKLAKIEGDIALLRQPKDFADFVKKGLAVTVFGGMLLAFGKFIVFGTV